MAAGREKRPNAGKRMEEYLQTLKEEGRLSSPGQMDKKGGPHPQLTILNTGHQARVRVRTRSSTAITRP